MRRALIIVTACVLLIGLSILGIHLWALSKIRQHEREVDALLLQRRSVSRPPLFGTALPGNAPDLHWQAMSAIVAMPEAEVPPPDVIAPFKVALRRMDLSDSGGVRNHEDLTKVRRLLMAGAEHHHRGARDAAAFEWLTIELGVVQDTLAFSPWLFGAEEQVLSQGLKLLTSHALTARELEEIALRLDALARTRPPLAEALRYQDGVERQQALRGERRTFIGSFVEAIPVDARHLWLPSVARAAALNEIAAYYRRLDALKNLAPAERIKAAEADGLPWRPKDFIFFYIQCDIESLTLRAILRAAVSAAWHQAKTGRLPEKLSEIPGYVPDTATAGLWTYSSGVFTYPSESKTWLIRRR